MYHNVGITKYGARKRIQLARRAVAKYTTDKCESPLISRGIFINTDSGFHVAIGLEVSVRSPRSKNDPNHSQDDTSSICFMWHAYVSELP